MCGILENDLTDFLSREKGQSVLSNNATGECLRPRGMIIQFGVRIGQAISEIFGDFHSKEEEN